MNKQEKDCLEKGETFTFEDEGLLFEVSAVLLSESADIEKDKNKGNKVAEEGIMPKKKEELGNEKVVKKEEGLPEEEVAEEEAEVVETEAEASEEEAEVVETEGEAPEEEAEVEAEASEEEAEEEAEEKMEDEAAEAPEEEVSRKKPPKPPREPDPCPGVSAKEHWPILRNRWFVILAGLVFIGIIAIAVIVGNNRGAAVFVPKEAISEEIVAARHELPLRVAYYTGGQNPWKTVDRWNFSLSKDSPVVWVYLRGGVPYYDEECRNKVPFSGENMGNLKNANSSLGPVTLAEDGMTWTVDKTGEKVAFLPGLEKDLGEEVSNFTAGGAKKPSFSEDVTVENDNDVVVLPVYPSAGMLFYNTGKGGWRSMPIEDWDGNTSRFEFWNFGYEDSGLRYWDPEMENPVSPSSSNAGNFFWMLDKNGEPQKVRWNGSAVQPL